MKLRLLLHFHTYLTHISFGEPVSFVTNNNLLQIKNFFTTCTRKVHSSPTKFTSDCHLSHLVLPYPYCPSLREVIHNSRMVHVSCNGLERHLKSHGFGIRTGVPRITFPYTHALHTTPIVLCTYYDH